MDKPKSKTVRLMIEDYEFVEAFADLLHEKVKVGPEMTKAILYSVQFTMDKDDRLK